jgi:phage terminase large subunit-like protein
MVSFAVIDAIPPTESVMTTLMQELGMERIQKFVNSLSPLEALLLQYDWDLYARKAQRPPRDNEWNTWVIMAGRGFGKTRPGAEQVITWSQELARDYSGSAHIALIATNPLDARAVMIEGESGILACSPPWYRPLYEPSKKQLRWDNGVIAHIYSAEEPDQLRGPQHHKLWGDEPCKWKYPQETWDMAQFGLRLGTDPQAMLTTTPRPIKMLIDILADPKTRVTSGHTLENQHNLAPRFLHTIMNKYAGTRLGQQELEAKLLTDTPGALWSQTLIDNTRTRTHPELTLIVVAIDPQANDPEELRKHPELLEETAETGIVVGGRGVDGEFYVLQDASDHYTPNEWGSKAVELYNVWHAECIVGEINNGGAMVGFTVKTAAKAMGQEVLFKEVRASRGKKTRAEPVAALYEQGRAHHVGAFSELESQMITWIPGLKSPDRMDAMVWACTEAMLLAPDDLVYE